MSENTLRAYAESLQNSAGDMKMNKEQAAQLAV
jgi:hypothetical protein